MRNRQTVRPTRARARKASYCLFCFLQGFDLTLMIQEVSPMATEQQTERIRDARGGMTGGALSLALRMFLS